MSTSIPTSKPAIQQQKNQLLQEMIRQQGDTQPDFRAHVRRIADIATATPLPPASVAARLLTSQEPIRLVHFSSQLDALEKTGDNNNINDKLWRSAIRFGRIDKGWGAVPDKVQPVGPFTVPSLAAMRLQVFPITLTFSNIFSLRYLYSLDVDSKGRDITRYLEFQCFLFNRLVYNRNVDRREKWIVYFLDENQLPGETIVVLGVENDIDEKEYERVLAFRR
jgi:hypothetical protein